MKRILMLFALSAMVWSCDTTIDDLIPEIPEATGEFTVTGAVSTSSTTDYPTEIMYLVSGSGGSSISSLQVSIGNIGQTDDVIVITLGELGNNDGFVASTYNYTTDANADLQLTAYYIDDNDTWTIYDQASSLTNQLIISSITNDKVTGTFEFNFQGSAGTDLIKVVGSFDGSPLF